jgi:DNA-binding NtrC family response regulator
MASVDTPPLRLLLVGRAGSEFAAAAQLARESGAEAAQAESPEAALEQLAGSGASLVMIEVTFDVGAFIRRLRALGSSVPVLACGIDAPAAAAVAAIKGGAADYVPLPPERELIAAAIGLFALRAGRLEVGGLVGHTVEEVERELILHTLDHCQGNRTVASTILGISVRTMRNKLRTFIEAGIPVAPPAA